MDEGSILADVKSALGVYKEDNSFDSDLIMHINSAFATLNQLGVGPEAGFEIIDGDETWDAFLGEDPKINSVKTYIYQKVKLIFDPPANSFLVDAIEKSTKEYEWRLMIVKDDQRITEKE